MDERTKKAIKQALNKPENNHLKNVVQERGIPLDQISATILPDDFEFEGSYVVDGEFCNTSGEYKEALAKKYGESG